MTTKKPNFIVKFDNSNPTEEERAKAICDLILCLMKLSAKCKETHDLIIVYG